MNLAIQALYKNCTSFFRVVFKWCPQIKRRRLLNSYVHTIQLHANVYIIGEFDGDSIFSVTYRHPSLNMWKSLAQGNEGGMQA
jgi:hypothetical protein